MTVWLQETTPAEAGEGTEVRRVGCSSRETFRGGAGEEEGEQRRLQRRCPGGGRNARHFQGGGGQERPVFLRGGRATIPSAAESLGKTIIIAGTCCMPALVPSSGHKRSHVILPRPLFNGHYHLRFTGKEAEAKLQRKSLAQGLRTTKRQSQDSKADCVP